MQSLLGDCMTSSSIAPSPVDGHLGHFFEVMPPPARLGSAAPGSYDIE